MMMMMTMKMPMGGMGGSVVRELAFHCSGQG